jgi:hypothetical protein
VQPVLVATAAVLWADPVPGRDPMTRSSLVASVVTVEVPSGVLGERMPPVVPEVDVEEGLQASKPTPGTEPGPAAVAALQGVMRPGSN